MTDEYRRIRKKWMDMHQDPELRHTLSPDIRDAWERSYQHDIDYMLKANPYILEASELKSMQENSAWLINISLPIMQKLSQFVAGTGFVVALCNSDLCNLKVVGDEDALEWAYKAHLMEGSLWKESLVGTNAGSLALNLGKPVSTYAYDHFCLFSISSAASSAPIFYENDIVGTLSMVAPFANVNNHTLGMVVAARDNIESTMTLKSISEYNQIIMESMSEGVLVLDNSGRITYANKNCGRILEQDVAALIGNNIYTLLGNMEQNRDFINSFTRRIDMIDESVILSIGSKRITCNITCTPLKNSEFDGNNGDVIIIRENYRIKRLVGNTIGNAKMTFDDIIGQSTGFKETVRNTKVAARSDSNVLLLGESGTGKDILAQAMHNESSRRMHPFVAINCAALPRELIASELFGYAEGAFTGAKKGGNIGKFELADQGTIFLDEIGDMPLDLQASLLRVLEEKSIRRLGANKLNPINTRIIAATNKNIEAAIERNTFRRDLFYRLGVIRINVPPLRERKDDIIFLTQHFTAAICKRLNIENKSFDNEVFEALSEYPWPGNVRELQNLLEAVIQLCPDKLITYDFVKSYLSFSNNDSNSASTPQPAPTVNENLKLTDLEKDTILACLGKNNNNKSKTAKELGMSLRTLYRRLEKYGIY
jgi:transcriptional regulator with PAS, ATPase and Fis domain